MSRRVTSPVLDPVSPHPDVLYFACSGLRAPEQRFVFHLRCGSLSLVGLSEVGTPLLVEQQLFTSNEVAIIVPMFVAHPFYCPYENLLASFVYGRIDEETLARAEETLSTAARATRFPDERMTEWDQVMRPVRNVLSRARLKLHAFNITIASVLETGYMLKPIVR